MKYLSSQPFTVAVSSPRRQWIPLGEYEAESKRRKLAQEPHEFENRGFMCGLCGLDEKAKIHCQHPFEKRSIEYKESIENGKRERKIVREFCECGVTTNLPNAHGWFGATVPKGY